MAANDLAKLVVRLEAQTAQYDATLKKATRELQKFQKHAGSALGKMEKQFSDFGKNLVKTFALGSITTAVFGLVSSVRATIQSGDELAKFASKTGLTAEAATELAHAAKMSDIELTAFATGIKKMQVEISKAGSSAEGTSPALAALGLTFENLSALNPDQQFELIAEQISKLQSPADKTRAAVELFGKAGADLLPMFEQGAAGIRAARQEAIDLGKSLSEIDLKRLQEADDAIKRMTASMGALGTQSALIISGPLGTFFDHIRLFLGGATEEEKLEEKVFAAKSFVNSLGYAITSPLGVRAVEDYATALEALNDFRISKITPLIVPEFDAAGFLDSPKDGDKETSQIDALKQQVAMYGRVGRAAEVSYQIASGALSKMTGPQQQQLLFLSKQLDLLHKYELAAGTLSTSELFSLDSDMPKDTTGSVFEKWKESLQAVSAKLQSIAIDDIGKVKEELAEVIATQNSLLNAPLMDGDLTRDVLPGLDSLSAAVEDVGERKLPEMGEAFKITTNEMSVYAEQAARNMQDHFADFLFDPFDNGIKGMLKGFVDILRKMLAEAMSAKIFEAIGGGSSGGGFTDFLGSLFSFGGGGGGGGGGIGVPMAAEGGKFSRGQPVIVGEEGPELFVPKSSGEVIPNDKSASIFASLKGMTPDLDIAGFRAAGGPVRTGAPYVVGEKGPELFVPGASGNIIPNGEGMGGTTVAPVYNIDARGATTELVKALPAILQENNRRLMESLRDARSRGQF